MKKKIALPIILLAVLLITGFIATQEASPIYVVFEDGTNLTDVIPLDDNLDLDIYRYTLSYTLGDKIGTEAIRAEQESAAQIEGRVWLSARGYLSRSLTTLNRTAASVTAAENQKGFDEHRDRYTKALAWYDETVANCWDSNSCPSINVTYLILNNLSNEQRTALLASPVVKDVKGSSLLLSFVQGFQQGFDWKPQIGYIESGLTEENRRFIRADSIWLDQDALAAVQTRGFYRLNFGLNESISSIVDPTGQTYIKRNGSIFTSNFPSYVQEFTGHRDFQEQFTVVGFDTDQFLFNLPYNGEWTAPNEGSEQDNANMQINVGKHILPCSFFLCRVIEQTCLISSGEEFKVAPIPGIYAWSTPPDSACSDSWASYLPFIGN